MQLSVGCDWTFNVEKAPWWGGAIGSMIRSTKRCFRKMIDQASLTHDELVTDIESIINSRPLSYISAGDRGITDAIPLVDRPSSSKLARSS